MDRRSFLRQSGAGALGLLGLDVLATWKAKALSAAPNLKNTKVETVRFTNADWM